MKKKWEIEAEVLFRCPLGEKVDGISYDRPAWVASAESGNIPLPGVPVEQKTFTLIIPEANDGLCALASKGKLEPPSFSVEGKCRQVLGQSSAWFASVEVSALIQCDGETPEDVHEPTIRIETGGPPDEPPPTAITFFASNPSGDSTGADLGLGVRFRGPINQRLGFEIGLSHSPVRDPSGAGSPALWTLDLHGLFQQPLNDRLWWTALAGVGWQFASDRSGESIPESTSLAPSVGLGFELQLSSRVAIETRALGRYRTNSVGDEWVLEGQAGLVFRLGRGKESGAYSARRSTPTGNERW